VGVYSARVDFRLRVSNEFVFDRSVFVTFTVQ
jgi:hypothetical protein